MKKLFLKGGVGMEAKATNDPNDGKYISVYEDGQLVYSILSGRSATRQMVIFPDGMNELYRWQVLNIAEIIENFDQHFNYLMQ